MYKFGKVKLTLFLEENFLFRTRAVTYLKRPVVEASVLLVSVRNIELVLYKKKIYPSFNVIKIKLEDPV